MLKVSDALQAQSRCKARLVERLTQSRVASSPCCDFGVSPDCTLVRFIQENEGNIAYEPEISQLRAAHEAVHAIAVRLAEISAKGRPIDIATQLAPHSNFGAASSTLLSAIWRLETKLNSLPS